MGCADGQLGERLRAAGHTVIGIDVTEEPGVRSRLDGFVRADLDKGVPDEAGSGFDVVLAADVIEHVRDPQQLLEELRKRLGPNGTIVASVPNFGHWYPRAKVALGRFDYDQRGILDRGHVRFFTRGSFERLADQAGLAVRRAGAVGVPLEVAARGQGRAPEPGGLADRLQDVAVRTWPTLCAYQFLYELRPHG